MCCSFSVVASSINSTPCNLLALTGDLSIAWPSPILAKLNSTDNPLADYPTKDELSWVASISGFGSMVGILPFSFLPDLIGRKSCLLMIPIPHMISFGLAAFGKSIYLLYVARFFSGISIAACYLVLPMYIAEISENSNRGLMLVSYAIFSNFGSLLCYATGPYMSMLWFNMFILIFPVTFFISFLFIAPESPYYYARKKDYIKASKSIERLRSGKHYHNAELELKTICDELDNAQTGDILRTITRKYAIKGSLIAIMLTTFQQLSGYAVFMPYTQTIFLEVGSDIDSAVCSIMVGSISFFSSFVCPFVIDKKGRRFVLITSLLGIITSEIVFGIYYYLSDQNYNMNSFTWVPLACLLSYMLFFTFGLGPLPLTVSSEVLPVNIKFLVTTVASFLGSLSSTVCSKYYYVLNDSLGYFGTIWLFAGFCTVLLVFIVVILPETKGRSFTEILQELDR
ncbi:hypothetical protein WA026_012223 [Henosepilachna vigintioctopunctata]|uniref:Major facilitator superfamily (MFS) profile domain-containing protein n=1 Tax=Henosepilachna vigintioctopunctata TaxID=420089 RepID=A0AAW1VFG6_9CUCU